MDLEWLTGQSTAEIEICSVLNYDKLPCIKFNLVSNPSVILFHNHFEHITCKCNHHFLNNIALRHLKSFHQAKLQKGRHGTWKRENLSNLSTTGLPDKYKCQHIHNKSIVKGSCFTYNK